uniref:S-phase cyclin A associated protein in the ER n=1 Tax=Pavo cristatus TaxID=9049 RepID=A0A8C9L2U9_PAVCR
MVAFQEVLMMLDNYVRDFKALIDWIQLQEKLEKADAQSSHMLTLDKIPSVDNNCTTSVQQLLLNASVAISATRMAPSGVSWADKVKANHGKAAGPESAATQTCLPAPMQKSSRKNDRRDAEGWETVQRGRPVRSRSTVALAAKAPVVAESLKSRGDSDKENVVSPPSEDKPENSLTNDGAPKSTELVQKDPVLQSEHPLIERTQVSNVLDQDSVSTRAPLQEDSLQTVSEAPPVLTNAACPPAAVQVNEASSAIAESGDQHPAEKAKTEMEMDPSDISNVSAARLSMAEVLAKKEELADRLEKANEEAIASAIAEEEQLTREIEAEENNDINIETDNDSDFSACMGNGSISFCGISMDWNDVLADYEARESWRQSNSWGDRVEEEPARPPGHGIHMHEKLSSPSRKRTIAESKKKHEEKQMKAQQLREKLREEKALKLQKLMEREKDVRKWKEELLDQRRRMMEEKLLHAEFKREVQLQAIVKKAQEEEAKVSCSILKGRYSTAKLYNEHERKRALEAERQARVEELLLKRKEQEARIEQQRQEKEKAREDAARERARDREERLAALTAAQQEAMEELQKKIQLKHDESIRRHMEQIEQRKEKAAELSSGRHANTDYAPKLTPYERKKQCSLCSVMVSQRCRASLSLAATNGASFTDKSIVRVAKEYESLMEAKNTVSDSPFKAKLQRLAKDLSKHLQMHDSCSLGNNKVSALDRTLGEISRILEKENTADQIAFRAAGGLTALEHVLQAVTAPTNLNTASRIPFKSLCSTVNAYGLTCNNCTENCTYILFSNKITFLMDLLMHQLTVNVPDDHNATSGRSANKQVFEGLTTGLLRITAVIFRCLISSFPDGNNHSTALKIMQEVKSKSSQVEAFNSRIQDLISYVVNIGLIDKLCCCFLSVQGPVDENPKIAAFLQNATALLHGICQLCFAVSGRSWNIFDSTRQDPTGLTAVLQATDLVGVLHMLYCVLFHGTISDPNTASPKDSYAENTIQVAIQSLRFFNSFAVLDLPAFQSIVGAEGLSLAFRHIISSLLWYCSQHTCEGLLHEVIICVGYFTVNNTDNQVIVQSGRHPTVLQKLCQLPFQYFSDPRLIKVLFPSLIAACYNNPQNKLILEQEMSCVLLATFIQDFAQSSGQMDNLLSQRFGAQDYLELSNRFPRQCWEEARQFFLRR